MTEEAFRRENGELRRRLAEAEEALSAIRSGQVDAIVCEDAAGTQIFSLSGAETVYRLTLETMGEAAINVAVDGTIVFCNSRFSELIGTPAERLLGRDIASFISPEDREDFQALLRRCSSEPIKQRVVFWGQAGVRPPALLSGSPLNQRDGVSLCLVAADLTELESFAHQIDQWRERPARAATGDRRPASCVGRAARERGALPYAGEGGQRRHLVLPSVGATCRPAA
jgi:PAS domain S-box-containing protein